MTAFLLKRIYDEPNDDDGYRVLIDRIWPRGMTKERAALDEWRKDVAPSSELRRWFGHRAERFSEFAERYREELEVSGAARQFAQDHITEQIVTLLIAAKDPSHNHGVVLLDALTSEKS